MKAVSISELTSFLTSAGPFQPSQLSTRTQGITQWKNIRIAPRWQVRSAAEYIQGKLTWLEQGM